MQNAQPDLPLECSDYSGRTIRLDSDTIEHITLRHPEMTEFLSRICDVALSPDFVYYRQRTNSYLFYRLGLLTGRLANTYMVVIIRYNDLDDGEGRTVYPTTSPARGDVLIHMGPPGGES